MILKRIGAILLVLTLALSLCVVPAAADGPLPAENGWSGSFASNGDYVFQMPVYLNTVAYAVFNSSDPTNDICAAKLETVYDNNTFDHYQMRIPAAAINGRDFDIFTFTIDSATEILAGSGTADTPWHISSELDLLKLMAISNASLDIRYMQPNTVFELKKDIEFHTPIGIALAPLVADTQEISNVAKANIGGGETDGSGNTNDFCGEFRGANKTISGLWTTEPNGGIGCSLFSSNYGTIRDLNIRCKENMSIEIIAGGYTYGSVTSQYNNIAILCKENQKDGEIVNCSVGGSVISHSVGGPGDANVYVGLIAARNYGEINGCWCSDDSSIICTGNTATNTSAYAGMIVGHNLAVTTDNQGQTIVCKGKILNCTAYGSLSIDQSTKNYAGGIAGYSESSNATAALSSISNCVNHASISCQSSGSNVWAGGITANLKNGSISYCYNVATITTTPGSSKNEYDGGIVGQCAVGATVIGCYNTGVLINTSSTKTYVGGIAAFPNKSSTTVTSCFSYVQGIKALGGQAKSVTSVFDLEGGNANGVTSIETATFASADYGLAGPLNAALPADSEKVFTLLDGAAYPTLMDRPVVTTIDLKAEGKVTAPAASVATVTAEAVGSTATLNVICAQACTVLYTTDGGTTYTRLDAAAADTGYDFTTTEYANGMTFVVAVKGDADGNGEVGTSDYIAIARSLLLPSNSRYQSLSALYSIIGDVDGNGEVGTSDYIAIARSLLLPSNARYAAIEW